MNLFGKKKAQKPQAPSAVQVIGRLKEAQEQLSKRQEHLERQKAATRAEGSKALKGGDKVKAKHLLMRIKAFDKQIESNYGKINNLDTQIMTLESATSDANIFDAMRMGQEHMKQTMNENQLDRVEDLMDDINEQQQIADDISNALSRPINQEMEMDDDELLEAFEAEFNTHEDVETEQDVDYDVHALPSAPVAKTTTTTTTSKTTTNTQEDAELAELMM